MLTSYYQRFAYDTKVINVHTGCPKKTLLRFFGKIGWNIQILKLLVYPHHAFTRLE